MQTMLKTTIHIVEPGTVVGKDSNGEDMIVTDDNAAFKGCDMWVTAKVWESLKERAQAVAWEERSDVTIKTWEGEEGERGRDASWDSMMTNAFGSA